MRRHVVLSLAFCCLALALLAARPGARAATPIPGCTDILVPYTPPAPPVTPAPPPSCVERPIIGPGTTFAPYWPLYDVQPIPGLALPRGCADGTVNHKMRCVPDGSYQFWQVQEWNYGKMEPGICFPEPNSGVLTCVWHSSANTYCGGYLGGTPPHGPWKVHLDPAYFAYDHRLLPNGSCRSAEGPPEDAGGV